MKLRDFLRKSLAREHSDNPSAHGTHGPWAHFLHHLQVAAVVASVVTVLHHLGWLGWLDATVLRVLYKAPAAVQLEPPGDLPRIVLIGDRLFEDEFGQASPLARDKLARLLQLIVDQRPAVLAIDLDLSPGPGDDQAAQQGLDGLILAAADSGIRVVLPLPLPVASPTSQTTKFAWMRRLCATPGIDFGLVDILIHSGSVLQFEARAPSLGILAAAEIGGHKPPEEGLCAKVREPDGRWAKVLLGKAYGDSLQKRYEFGSHPRQFNSRFLAHVGQLTRRLESLDDLQTSSTDGPAPLTGRTVFLGSGYSVKELFPMPLVDAPNGLLEGVAIHAAVYASSREPVTAVEGALAYWLDLLLGILAATLFARTWQHYRNANDAWRHQGRIRDYAANACWLGLNFVLLVIVAYLCLVLAGNLFYPCNVWINPGPILLGVFVKFMLASRSEADDQRFQQTPAARRLHQGVTAIVILSGWVFIVLHHLHH